MATRTLLTEVDIPNSDNALIAGMYAQVSFHMPGEKALLFVPATAVLIDARGTHAATVRDNAIAWKDVVIDGDLGDKLAIARSGLAEGDVVVTRAERSAPRRHARPRRRVSNRWGTQVARQQAEKAAVNSRSTGNSHLARPADTCRPVGRPRSEAARLRILAATRELLDEQGFRSMTMGERSPNAPTRAQVTLYKWWSLKAAVVLDAMLAEVSRPIIPYRDSESPLVSLRDQMKGFTRFLRSRKAQLLIAVLAEGVLDEKVGDAFRGGTGSETSPGRCACSPRLARSTRASLRADVDVDVVLDALFGPLYYRALVNHLPLDPLFGERVFHYVVTGIATEPARVKLA